MKRIADDCVQAFLSVINEVSPANCVRNVIKVNGDVLQVRGRSYVLKNNVHIVAIGKAALPMVQGAEQALGDQVRAGVASVPVETKVPLHLKTKFFHGAADNLPDESALNNSQKIAKFLTDHPDKESRLVLFLISGGASALLCAPTKGVSLIDKLKTIKLMATNGASITELNTVRIAISDLKGGKLAQLAAPSKCISLIMSDIVGGHMDKVGSGPTVPQTLDPTLATECLKRRGVYDQVPESVREALNQLEKVTSKPLNNIQNELVADNSILLSAFQAKLTALDIATSVISNQLEGDASKVGHTFADHVLNWARTGVIAVPFASDAPKLDLSKDKLRAFVYGGETTVRFADSVDMNKAKGGRNQEMVLAFLQTLNQFRQELMGHEFLFMSVGSDGQDGPTDAAGAFFTSDDLAGHDDHLRHIDQFLTQKRSYQFWSGFQAGQRIVKIGKTGNNLMDLQVLIVEQRC